MIVLALDLGDRRTGVALGDTRADIVMALTTIQHTTSTERHKKIMELINEKKPAYIAIGLPVLLSGKEGEQALSTRKYIDELQKVTSIPIITIDERFSSTEAISKEHADIKAACSIAEIALKIVQDSAMK